ncbi:MAG TPA: cob(I)yrinic acid a,c-diamide adenosyltransferase [Spirochaetota bacterium]|nr:cob(I)yrinic acid a,c-diamide adenosyltransferase [Spirochaetota bacterium]HQE58235.1 cob(I)yrinic acid a,c-diamide adenosyltransferase [Spirochaetota bacterium]
MKETGKVQLYIGNGKGKTTAALGLAFRAMGCGKKTLILQFMKNGCFNELKACVCCDDKIVIEQYGQKEFYLPAKSNYIEHRASAKKGIDRAFSIIENNEYNLLVLDEIVNALYFNLITFEEIENIIRNKPSDMDMVLTGREAPDLLIELCDLVTEMKEVKHYYSAGEEPREGIEF